MSRSLKNEISNLLTMKNFYFVQFKIQNQVRIRDQLKLRQQVCEKIVIGGQRIQVLDLIKTQVSNLTYAGAGLITMAIRWEDSK
jgi:hypothetical protein